MKSMLVILLLLCGNLAVANNCKSVFVDKAVQKEIEKNSYYIKTINFMSPSDLLKFLVMFNRFVKKLNMMVC